MATKTISITEEAYERLASNRKNKESFSEIIERITNKADILDYAGALTDLEASSMEKRINESRKESRSRMEKVRGEMAQ